MIFLASAGTSGEAVRPGRELEVLQHLASGQRNRSIAGALNISENTVKFHVGNIFRKMGVNSRTEAIALATSYGLR